MGRNRRPRRRRDRRSKQQRDLDRRIDAFVNAVGPATFWVKEHTLADAQRHIQTAYVKLDALDNLGLDPHTTKRTQPAIGTRDLPLTEEQRTQRIVDELGLAQHWALRKNIAQVRVHMLEATIEMDALIAMLEHDIERVP